MNIAVYDFAKAPITFDFCIFLATARLIFSRENGVPEFWLDLDARSWRNDTPREKSYTVDERLWRLHNLIMPIISTAPGISGFSVHSLPSAEIGFGQKALVFHAEESHYLTSGLRKVFESFPYDPHLFLAPQTAITMASRILRVSHGKPSAVVAVRHSTFEPERDSQDKTLTMVCRSLIDQGFCVFLIPDQESSNQMPSENDDICLVKEAAFNLPLRLALYELADITICPASGPTSFAALSIRKPNMIIHSPIHPSVPTATAKWHTSTGLDVGSSQPFPWTPVNQRWLWDISPSSNAIVDAAISLLSTSNRARD